MARTITNEDIDILIQRFREIFYDKQESEEKTREIVADEIKRLPTRDEFFEETAKIHKHQSDLEEEKDILAHRVSIHSDQIQKLSKHVSLPLVD